MLFSFRIAILLGAGLLFLVQPLFAKMVLPLLGGSPAVWNTCMLFFQGMLLAGYAYAHATHRWLPTRGQVILHLAILIAILFVPAISIGADWKPPADQTPVFWLLGVLLVVVGAPFFAVSATSPILQMWFTSTDHSRSKDPYFLYAASNVGSLVALLAYPFVLESFFRLEDHAMIWKYGYWLFVATMIICGVQVLRSKTKNRDTPQTEVSDSNSDPTSDPLQRDQSINWFRRGYWIVLAFVPSSWMLGVTSFLTTDISPMPILWIIPLSLYLLTFIIAFAEQDLIQKVWVSRAFPIGILVLTATTIFGNGFLVMGLHLVVFFIGALACHNQLSESRPPASGLTEFYFWVSFGGLLGGVFNGMIAPLFFPWILEYPITLIAACLLRPDFGFQLEVDNQSSETEKAELRESGEAKHKKSTKGKRKREKREDSSSHAVPDAREIRTRSQLILFLIFGVTVAVMAQLLPFQGTLLLTIVTLGSLGILSLFYFLNRPFWFGIPVGIVLIMSQLEPPQAGESVLLTSRGFYGVNRVVDGPGGIERRLYHGTTVHGIQNRDPEQPDLHDQPMTYYHRLGPMGSIFQNAQIDRPFKKVAVIGLGAGSAASYCRENQFFTFYEIDPIVKAIAENENYFTYLSKCGPERYQIVLGDGRFQLAQSNEKYDLIVFDAFSSDAIPVHLLTVEALAMYREKLTPNGFMAFHISNLYFDLEPVLGDLAAQAQMVSLTSHDLPTPEEEKLGKRLSSYVVIANQLADTGLEGQAKWTTTRVSKHKRAWSDDFSNVLDALK